MLMWHLASIDFVYLFQSLTEIAFSSADNHSNSLFFSHFKHSQYPHDTLVKLTLLLNIGEAVTDGAFCLFVFVT